MTSKVFALAIALGVAFGAHASPRPQTIIIKPLPPPRAASGPKTPPPARVTNFYYYGSEPLHLVRSPNELVVRFGAIPADERRSVIASLGPAVTPAEEVVTEGRTFQLLKVRANDQEAIDLVPFVDKLRASAGVELASPVFYYEETGSRMLPTSEILVKLKEGLSQKELATLAASLELNVVRKLRGTGDEFVLELKDAKSASVFEKARALYESGRLQWAEPNFIRQYRKFATPNDPLFPQQWHLSNSGQSGGKPSADVDAVRAWDFTQGSPVITIAIVDDGVEMTHEDLAENSFTNEGEIAGNGIDDDHNGYVDDVHGWDFSNNDNDANPESLNDNHGTAVAGVAAARGDNAIGVTGICQRCRILPVKIFSPDYAGDSVAAEALRYAASLADVVNNSWGGTGPSSAIRSAIQSASYSRNGKGTPMFFAAGDGASRNFAVSIPSLPAGTHRFRWTYSKDSSFAAGADSAWLVWALFPGGVFSTPFNMLHEPWMTGGYSGWGIYYDFTLTDEGNCLTNARKSLPLNDNQSNYLEIVKTVVAGDFLSFQGVSSEEGYDGLTLQIDLDNDGSYDLTTPLLSGNAPLATGINYPAAYPEAIAVGASTNFDCRAHYSQCGPQLAFVAPSNGSPLTAGIVTTDRSGDDGYGAGEYTAADGSSSFGGTSAATALASGIAGLALSRNPTLSASGLKSWMDMRTVPIGPASYYGLRNDRYGRGRLNAYYLTQAIGSCDAITVTPAAIPDAETSSFFSQTFTANGGTAPYTFSIGIPGLPAGLTLSASGELSGTPTSVGTYSFTVVATDANNCSGYRAITFIVTHGSNPDPATQLYITTPCRVLDSRTALGPIAHLGTRDVQFTGTCGIPSTAKAVVVNITAVGPTAKGFLALYPAGVAWPGISTINYRAGKTRANNAIVTLSATGEATILNNGSSVDYILDVTGYFQ